MQSRFTTPSDNREYIIDGYGIIKQLDRKQFVYDEKYVSTYDTPEYKEKATVLQAMRYGFACAAHSRPISSLLDYGCGNGEFLKFAKRGIRNVYGFDISGIREIEDIEVVESPIAADVWTFWDVLEHIPEIEFIEDAPCATICISLPNCVPHSIEEFDSWHHRKPDEHLYHFNANSLTAFMQNMGWKRLAVSYHEDIIRRRETLNGNHNILSMAFTRSEG